MTTKSRYMLEIFLVFLAVVSIYLSNLYFDYTKDIRKNGNAITITREGYRNTITSVDNIPNALLPYLILEKHTIYFDSILNIVKKFDDETAKHPYFLMPTPKGFISVYPLMTSLIVLPFYIIPMALKNPDLNYYENIMMLLVLSRIVAAFLTALAVSTMYASLNIIHNKKLFNLIAILFLAFGTSLYTIASRGIWMHTTSVLIISILIYLLLKYQKLLNKNSNFQVFLLGLLMGILVLVRLTNIIIVIPLSIYLILQYKKNIIALFVGALPSILALLYMNYTLYGSIVSNGYIERNDFHWTTSYLVSIPGLFISPARGFLFLTPILLIGIGSIFKWKKLTTLYKTFLIICVLQILVIGKWWAWEGANAFGNRMLTEIIPFLFILTIEQIKNIKNKVETILILLAITYSILVHTHAVFNEKSRCSRDNNWNFKCLTKN